MSHESWRTTVAARRAPPSWLTRLSASCLSGGEGAYSDLAIRARIVLAAAEGESNARIAARLCLTPQTVGKWRARYVTRGLDGLLV